MSGLIPTLSQELANGSQFASVAVWIKCSRFVHLVMPSQRRCKKEKEREGGAGTQWEFESNGPEAAAEMLEEELTPVGSHAIPVEQVPEAGPTWRPLPCNQDSAIKSHSSHAIWVWVPAMAQ